MEERCKKKHQKLEKVENTKLHVLLKIDKVCKHVYDKMINNVNIKHQKIETWSNKLGFEIQEDAWKQSFVMLRKATISSVLRSFQYMVLHNAIVTNDYLYKCNIKDTDKCYFCGESTEKIEHLLWDCLHIQTLWFELAATLKPFINIEDYLRKDIVLLGNDVGESELLIIHLFTLVKRYIYVQKCKEKILSIHGLMIFIKQHYVLDTFTEAEKRIKKWDRLQEYISNFV